MFIVNNRKDRVTANLTEPIPSPKEEVRVVDGDTIFLKGSGEYGRLVCIDAPETEQMPWGITASKELTALLNKADYVIERIGTDRYGRQLVLIKLKNTTAQEYLVKQGLAYVYHDFAQSCPIYGELVDIENDARSSRLGVWSSPSNVPPWIFRRNKVRQY